MTMVCTHHRRFSCSRLVAVRAALLGVASLFAGTALGQDRLPTPGGSGGPAPVATFPGGADGMADMADPEVLDQALPPTNGPEGGSSSGALPPGGLPPSGDALGTTVPALDVPLDVPAEPPVSAELADPFPAQVETETVSAEPSADDEAAAAEGGAEATDGDAEGGEEAPTEAKAPSVKSVDGVNVVDLSDIDLEEAPVEWQSMGEYVPADLSGVSRIEDIVEPPSEYHYAAFGKPNPFEQPNFDVAETNDVTEIPMVSELQKYPLDKLVVRGIWQQSNGEWRAMIMTPDRGGVVAKQGDPIAAGKILTVDKDRVVARQYKIRGDGAREYTDVNMFLGPEPESRGTIRFRPGKDPEFNVAPTLQRPAAPAAQAAGEAGPDAAMPAGEPPMPVPGMAPQGMPQQPGPADQQMPPIPAGMPPMPNPAPVTTGAQGGPTNPPPPIDAPVPGDGA